MMNKKVKRIGSSSVEVLLPVDLILEIFSHLPPTCVVRLKSISKTFNSHMSNTHFLVRNTVYQGDLSSSSILLKRNGFSGDSHILIYPPPPSPPPPPMLGDGDGNGNGNVDYYYTSQLLQNLIDYQPEHGDDKVNFCLIDSCNGLLLYLNCLTYHNPTTISMCIWYICNPVTKDYIKLPTLEKEQVGFEIYNFSAANIVFDPSVSLTYKVVIWLRCMSYNSRIFHYRLYVYSSETRLWRLSYTSTQSWTLPISVNDWVLQNHFNHNYRAVLLKGVLYWSALFGPHLDDSLCYDVHKDFVWTLKLPEKPVEFALPNRVVFYFGVCDGGLRLIEKYYNRANFMIMLPSTLDVMELNQLQLQQQQQKQQQQRDRAWTIKYRLIIEPYVDFVKECSLFDKECSLFDVLVLHLYKTKSRAGEEEEEMLVYLKQCLLISYNFVKNSFGKKLRTLPSIMVGGRVNHVNHTSALQYNISLFPLH